MVGRSFHYKFGVHFPGKMARCIVFSQSSVPSGNSPADEPDEADSPDEAETVSATAAPTSPVIAPGARITALSKQTPSNNIETGVRQR